MSIGSKGTVTELFSVMTIGFALQTQIREISVKRIRATSAYEQHGGKVTLQLACLGGKELVTVPQLIYKNSHTYSQKVNHKTVHKAYFPSSFRRKNRKYPTNFICGSFHQSAEPAVRSFLKFFVILCREMLITVY